MNFLESLEWRYATKKMSGEKIADEQRANILKAIQLAPSSMGFQPFTVLVIEDEATRAAIAPACYNQPQITGSSAVLVFCAWTAFSEAQVDTYMQNIATTRGVDVESLAGFKANLFGLVQGRTQEQLQEWAARQAYIALGFGLAAAATEGVDATPMEGFDPTALDAALGLAEKGLKSAVILALGKRDAANDYLVNAKKVRRSADEFFVFI